MIQHGGVSYRVKRAVAFHERFTIAQLVDITGLTYGQVERVVHRLVERKAVRNLSPGELNEAEREVERRVGRPRARYELTNDPTLRAEFLASLEAVAAAVRLELASNRRPDTPYYTAALRAIEAMEADEEQVSFSLLEIEQFLIYGREYEALVPEGFEVVQTYYDLALARLDILGGKFTTAIDLLEQVKETMIRTGQEEKSYLVTGWQLAARVTQVLNEVSRVLRRGDDPLPPLGQLRETLLQTPGSPLRSPLCRALDLLTEVLAPGSRVRASRWSRRQNTKTVNYLTSVLEWRSGSQRVSSGTVQYAEENRIARLIPGEEIRSPIQ